MARAHQAEARDRARAAKRRMDASRAERDRRIEESATEFFAAQIELEAAKRDYEARITAASTDAGNAVLRLTELGESAAAIAELLELDSKEVNRLRRSAAAKHDSLPQSHESHE